MALTHHKPIIVDLGDDFKYKLTWDKEINDVKRAVHSSMYIIFFILSLFTGVEDVFSLDSEHPAIVVAVETAVVKRE